MERVGLVQNEKQADERAAGAEVIERRTGSVGKRTGAENEGGKRQLAPSVRAGPRRCT